jgi:hypothetical protein
MSKFKLFKPWTWFSSEERKIVKMSDGSSGWASPTHKPSYGVQGSVELIKPYKNIYFTGTSVVVVLNDGNTIMKNGVDDTIVPKIEACNTIPEIITALSSKEQPLTPQIKEAEVETKEERKIVNDNLAIIRNSEDFIVNEEGVFLKDVKLPIPAVVVGTFIELLERVEAIEKQVDKDAFTSADSIDEVFTEIADLTEVYEGLKMFWYWTALNPIESARNDLFNFIRKNDITITTNGLLAMYRKVVSVKEKEEGASKTLVEFISNSYTKVKKWKKAPKNYEIYSRLGEYMLLESDRKSTDKNLYWDRVGNLHVLYYDLDKLQGEQTYTDNHTRTKDIKIGAIYKEDEDKIDLNNQRDCSNGLHVGSKSFGFDGFGDVGVLCLVNPMYVRSVPVSAVNKMRVSEMFIAGEMGIDEYVEDIDSQQVVDYSNEYCSSTVAELKDAVKNMCYSSLVCQGNKPAVEIKEIPNILKHIEERVLEVV